MTLKGLLISLKVNFEFAGSVVRANVGFIDERLSMWVLDVADNELYLNYSGYRDREKTFV
jgi:hypothetical protein